MYSNLCMVENFYEVYREFGRFIKVMKDLILHKNDTNFRDDIKVLWKDEKFYKKKVWKFMNVSEK